MPWNVPERHLNRKPMNLDVMYYLIEFYLSIGFACFSKKDLCVEGPQEEAREDEEPWENDWGEVGFKQERHASQSVD